MRIAVLTLTRDRLAYSRHCFATLREHAGIEYDHFILDNHSQDRTVEWLLGQEDLDVTTLNHNAGICAGLNVLLDEALNAADYDVVVRVDNDAELTQPGTLAAVCEAALEHNAILAPHIAGLNNPPAKIDTVTLGEHTIDRVHHVGGIFMAIPAALFSQHGFRYDESQPLWGGDEMICPWWAAQAGLVGYLHGWTVNHYLTTNGQVDDQPGYFRRRVLEGGPAR